MHKTSCQRSHSRVAKAALPADMFVQKLNARTGEFEWAAVGADGECEDGKQVCNALFTILLLLVFC